MAENKWKIEYAKTGRAKCKDSKCKEIVEAGTMRIGKECKNPFGEEGDTMLQWYHAACAFSAMQRMRAGTKKVESKDDLEGFEDLKAADQKVVEGYIAGEGVGEAKKGGAKKKGAKRKKKDDDDDEDEEEEEKPKKKKKAAPKKKAAAAAAPADIANTTYLEVDEKFWRCAIDGSAINITFGKIGSAGRTTKKECESDEDAKAVAAKAIAAKRKEGYAEPGSAAPKKAAKEEEDDEEEEEEEEDAKEEKKKPKKKAAPKKAAKAAPKAKAAAASSGGKTHLESDSSSGGKFWEIEVRGSETYVTYGRTGSDGATQVKDWGSAEKAQKEADKLIRQKTKKGYA